MKTWWTKFRISRELDARIPAAGSLTPSADAPELQQFAADLRMLDQRLKRARPGTAVPPGLHDSVMHAVRESATEPACELQISTPLKWRGVLTPALALVAVAGLAWWFIPQRAASPAFLGRTTAATALINVGTTTLSAGQRMAFDAPAAALAPLEREMRLFQSDVKLAAQLAMSSLP